MQSQEMSTNPESEAEDAQQTDTLESSAETPTNIIFLIGDGMGTSQVSAAYFYGEEGTQPNFSRFPILGLINTTSGSDRITDSGAGATAVVRASRRALSGARWRISRRLPMRANPKTRPPTNTFA